MDEVWDGILVGDSMPAHRLRRFPLDCFILLFSKKLNQMGTLLEKKEKENKMWSIAIIQIQLSLCVLCRSLYSPCSRFFICLELFESRSDALLGRTKIVADKDLSKQTK